MVVAEKLYNKLCESYTQLLRMSYHQAQARTVGLLCTSAALKRGEDCKGLSCQGMKELDTAALGARLNQPNDWGLNMKKSLLYIALLFVANNAFASCRCACVNGSMQSLCTSSLDIPAMCMGMCPMTPPSIQPLPSLQLPPLGTSQCTQKQVFNQAAGRYEWRSVCQ